MIFSHKDLKISSSYQCNKNLFIIRKHENKIQPSSFIQNQREIFPRQTVGWAGQCHCASQMEPGKLGSFMLQGSVRLVNSQHTWDSALKDLLPAKKTTQKPCCDFLSPSRIRGSEEFNLGAAQFPPIPPAGPVWGCGLTHLNAQQTRPPALSYCCTGQSEKAPGSTSCTQPPSDTHTLDPPVPPSLSLALQDTECLFFFHCLYTQHTTDGASMHG